MKRSLDSDVVDRDSKRSKSDPVDEHRKAAILLQLKSVRRQVSTQKSLLDNQQRSLEKKDNALALVLSYLIILNSSLVNIGELC
jgi:uncharacterized membrane protein